VLQSPASPCAPAARPTPAPHAWVAPPIAKPAPVPQYVPSASRHTTCVPTEYATFSVSWVHTPTLLLYNAKTALQLVQVAPALAAPSPNFLQSIWVLLCLFFRPRIRLRAHNIKKIIFCDLSLAKKSNRCDRSSNNSLRFQRASPKEVIFSNDANVKRYRLLYLSDCLE
jgi:hypothetical protein